MGYLCDFGGAIFVKNNRARSIVENFINSTNVVSEMFKKHSGDMNRLGKPLPNRRVCNPKKNVLQTNNVHNIQCPNILGGGFEYYAIVQITAHLTQQTDQQFIRSAFTSCFIWVPVLTKNKSLIQNLLHKDVTHI